MFQCDQLIYIQMQKTGCTHIASLLSQLFDGDQIGKHNAATPQQIKSIKYFISSIRNPWDWYLSLWTFGLQGKGAVWKRLTKRNHRRYHESVNRSPLRDYSLRFIAMFKDASLRRDVYGRGDNVESFRRWLKLIHNSSNSHILGEGYGKTAIADLCGFMTYRYLYLCCQNAGQLNDPRSISSYVDLVQFEHKNCYINFFIRQESLEDDLCKAVEKIRPLTQKEREFIYGAQRTNTSKRTLPISEYYDKESVELVRARDRLLIDKFNYSPPLMT